MTDPTSPRPADKASATPSKTDKTQQDKDNSGTPEYSHWVESAYEEDAPETTASGSTDDAKYSKWVDDAYDEDEAAQIAADEITQAEDETRTRLESENTYLGAVGSHASQLGDLFVSGGRTAAKNLNALSALKDARNLTDIRAEIADNKGKTGFFANMRRSGLALKESTTSKNLKTNLADIKRHGDAAATASLSPITQEFLDENSERGVFEILKSGSGTIISELIVSSLAQSIPSMALGAAAAVPAGARFGPTGALIGMAAGSVAGSARMEFASSLVDGLQEKGIDITDSESVMKAVNDKELMGGVQSYAAKRAAVIGGAEGLATLVGGKVFGKAIGNKLLAHLSNAGVQLVAQPTIAATGEATAQLVTGTEIDNLNWREIAAEAIAETGQAMIETPITLAAKAKAGEFKADQPTTPDTEQPDTEQPTIPGTEQPETGQPAAPDTDPETGEITVDSVTERYQEIEDSAQEARELVAEEGGDALAQEMAAMDTSDSLGEAMSQTDNDVDAVQAMLAEEQESMDQDQADIEAMMGEFDAEQVTTPDNDEVSARADALVAEALEAEQPATPESTPTEQPATPESTPTEQPATPESTPTEQLPPVPTVPEVEQTPEVAQTDAGIADVDPETGEVLNTQQNQEVTEAAQAPVSDDNLALPTGQEDAQNGLEAAVSRVPNLKTLKNPKNTATERLAQTKGFNGKQVEALFGSDSSSGQVFIVDEVDSQTGEFIRSVPMIGYANRVSAAKAYKDSSGKAPTVMSPLSNTAFGQWVKSDNPAKGPFSPEAQPPTKPNRTSAEVAADNIKEAQAKTDSKPLNKLGVDDSGLPNSVALDTVDTATARSDLMAKAALVNKEVEFTVDEGNRTGVPSTKDGVTKNNVPMRVMMEEAKAHFEIVKRVGSRLVLKQPRKGARQRINTESASRTVSDANRAMPHAKVSLLPSVHDLPQITKDRMNVPEGATVKGMYDRKDGTVYVFQDAIKNPEEMQRVLAHEIFGHKGMRALLGDAQHEAFLSDVFDSADSAVIADLADSYDLDVNNAEDRVILADEYVANLAEGDIDSPFFKRVIAKVRSALRKLGADVSWSDNDIRSILRQSRKATKGDAMSSFNVSVKGYDSQTGEAVQRQERADKAIRRLHKNIAVIDQLKGCVK